MLSKTNYFTITLIMIGVLLMFQLTGVSESLVMNPGENPYDTVSTSTQQKGEALERYENRTQQLLLSQGQQAEVGLVGEQGDCLEVARQWCLDQGKSYCRYDTLAQAAEDVQGAQFLVVEGSTLTEEDQPALEELGEQGRSVVVSGLPDTDLLRRNQALRQSLGIARIRQDEVTVEGLKLFAGLLLGGETVYEEYEYTMPDCQLGDSVTAYMVGQSQEEWFQELENEELPAVIWRYAPGAGSVYVVNGDFLETTMGAGLLTGFAANSSRVYFYPVVNAQVSVLKNYPMVSEENSAVMEREYGQDSVATLRDIVWPSIAATFEDNGDKMTAVASLRYDYQNLGETNSSLITYYYEQVTKAQGELGLSVQQISQVPLSQKLQEDLDLLQEELPNYTIHTLYAGPLEPAEYLSLLGEENLLKSVTTVLTDYEETTAPLFSYEAGNILTLPLYMDGTVMEEEDRLRAQCLQTAYGYYGTGVDLMRVVYPQGEEDLWNVMSNQWAKNYRPYRTPFECFDKVTATEADSRVRNYLALEYTQETEGNTGRVELSGAEEGYFLVRTHGETLEILEGGSCQEIEEGWYLVQMEGQTLRFSLEQEDKAEYYIDR